MFAYNNYSYTGTETSGYMIPEDIVRVTYTSTGAIVTIRNVRTWATGSTTVTIPLTTTHTTTYVTKVHSLPPKNWRWFDSFRTPKPYIVNVPRIRYKPKIEVMRNSLSKVQINASKRKLFIQNLRKLS